MKLAREYMWFSVSFALWLVVLSLDLAYSSDWRTVLIGMLIFLLAVRDLGILLEKEKAIDLVREEQYNGEK